MTFSAIGLSFEEEGLEDVSLFEYSLDGDDDETGGVGGGPLDCTLGWGLS